MKIYVLKDFVEVKTKFPTLGNLSCFFLFLVLHMYLKIQPSPIRFFHIYLSLINTSSFMVLLFVSFLFDDCILYHKT